MDASLRLAASTSTPPPKEDGPPSEQERRAVRAAWLRVAEAAEAGDPDAYKLAPHGALVETTRPQGECQRDGECQQGGDGRPRMAPVEVRNLAARAREIADRIGEPS